HSFACSRFLLFVGCAARPFTRALGPCLIALFRFGSYWRVFPLASGNRLLRCLSPIHTKPLRLANFCVSFINASILRYFLKKSSRNFAASSGVMRNACASPYLLAPYIDISSTTFIFLRSGVSPPLGNL